MKLGKERVPRRHRHRNVGLNETGRERLDWIELLRTDHSDRLL
jgi:hypothetical protein